MAGNSYRFLLSTRFLILLVVMVGTSMFSSCFATIHFAWYCMVNDTAFTPPSNATTPSPSGATVSGSLLWDSSIKQNVFAAYSYGGIALIIPAGWLIDKIGARLVFTTGLVLAGAGTVLIPVATIAGYGVVILLRVIVGMGASLSLPIIYSTCSHWCAKSEIGISIAISGIGLQVGQFVTSLLSGQECKRLGWQYVFYLSGGFTLAFIAVWLLTYTDDPADHRCIRRAELDYILANRNIAKKGKSTIPIKKIITSPAVLSCFIVSFFFYWSAYFINQFTPAFFHDVHGSELENTGYMAAIPFLGQIGGRLISGPLSDLKWWPSTVFKVKCINTVALVGAAAFTVVLAFVSSIAGEIGSMLLLTAVLLFQATATAGYLTSPVLIAPQYSGTIGSMITMAGYTAAIAMPYTVTQLTQGESISGWQTTFIISGCFLLAGAVVFLVFGKADVQPWARQPEPEQTLEVSSIALRTTGTDAELA
jgi:MFS family permease